MISIHYKIYGKVQGVAYRAFVRDKANQLGVVGWVKNINDGSVECVACADQETLDQFEAELNKGSNWTRVDRIEKQKVTEIDGFENFCIKR